MPQTTRIHQTNTEADAIIHLKNQMLNEIRSGFIIVWSFITCERYQVSKCTFRGYLLLSMSFIQCMVYLNLIMIHVIISGLEIVLLIIFSFERTSISIMMSSSSSKSQSGIKRKLSSLNTTSRKKHL